MVSSWVKQLVLSQALHSVGNDRGWVGGGVKMFTKIVDPRS